MKQNRIILTLLVASTVNLFYAQEQSEDNIFSAFEANLIKEKATSDEIGKYIQYFQSADKKNIKYIVRLFSQYREYIFTKESEEVSKKLYPMLIELICNEQRTDLVDIIDISHIITSLDKKVSAENIQALSHMIKKIRNREDYGDGSILQEFVEVMFKKGEPFLQLFGDLLQIPDINTHFLAEMIIKYPNRFQKYIIAQSQKRNKAVDNIVYDTLFSLKLIDNDATMFLILNLFQDKEIDTFNEESKENILSILVECIYTYIEIHEPELTKNLDTFLENFSISENTSNEVINAIFYVLCYYQQGSPNIKDSIQSSSKLYPIICGYLDKSPNNYSAIKLLLLCRKADLAKNIDYLEILFQENENNISICHAFATFILEQGEPFLYFYSKILTTNNDLLNEGTLAKIFDKYEEKVSVFLENAVVHTDKHIQRRAIHVLSQTRSKFSNDFIATHFTKVLHALDTFHFEHALYSYQAFARRIDFKKVLPIILSRQDEFLRGSFFFSSTEYEINNALASILKEESFDTKRYPYLAHLKTSQRGNLEWIAKEKGIVGRNLLQVIAEYKIDREDAIIAALYLLTEPELELEAKNTIIIFPQEKIRKILMSEDFFSPLDKKKEEIVRQKLTDIFGKDFFAEEKKE